MMEINKKLLAKCIAIPLLAGGVAGLLTRRSMEMFAVLEKPPLAPPGWLFPVVWTILYTLMGISSYLILESETGEEEIAAVMKIYFFQLLVNFLWPTFFFNFGWYFFSLLWLLLLWVLVLVMIIRFYKIDKTAGYLQIPYLVWLTFAAYLNLGIWWLNS